MVMISPRVPGSSLSFEDEEALISYGGTQALDAARTENQPRIAPQGTEQVTPPAGVEPAPAPPPVQSYWESQAAQAAERHGLDPAYFVKQIRQESGFADDVISGRRKSSAGAIGIAQFMPLTAKAYGVDPLKPIEALDGAARYVRDNLAQFGGDYRKAFAAYNAGAGGVQRAIDRGGEAWESQLPGETRTYLAAIFGDQPLTSSAQADAPPRIGGMRVAGNAITQAEANRYTDEAGRLGAGYQYEQMPDDEYREQLVGRVAAKLRALRYAQKLSDSQIQDAARAFVVKSEQDPKTFETFLLEFGLTLPIGVARGALPIAKATGAFSVPGKLGSALLSRGGQGAGEYVARNAAANLVAEAVAQTGGGTAEQMIAGGIAGGLPERGAGGRVLGAVDEGAGATQNMPIGLGTEMVDDAGRPIKTADSLLPMKPPIEGEVVGPQRPAAIDRPTVFTKVLSDGRTLEVKLNPLLPGNHAAQGFIDGKWIGGGASVPTALNEPNGAITHHLGGSFSTGEGAVGLTADEAAEIIRAIAKANGTQGQAPPSLWPKLTNPVDKETQQAVRDLSDLYDPPLSPAPSPDARNPFEPPRLPGAGTDVREGRFTPGAAALAGNIRLTKYPEDLRATIKQWADENPDVVQAARRGVKSDAEVLADAKELVDDVGGDFGRLQRRWKSGDAWNAEEITAIRGTLRAKTDDVLAAAQTAKLNDSSENQARLLLAIQEQARVQEVVHGVTAEAGRSLRAFRQEVFDATKTGDTQKLQELLRRVGVKKPIGEITEELSGAIGKLDIENPVAVNAFLRDMQKPQLWDYVMELWINSILSGPKTHIINALSNTLNMVTSPIERAAAAGVERVLAPVQGRKVARFFSEAPADAAGAVQGIPEGISAALRTIRDGITPAQASKWEFRKTAFRGTLGRVVRAPGTALEAADTLNYSINYRSALNALIVRQARSEGLSGAALVDRIATLKGEPTESLIKNAAATAEYRLFRQEPGEITSAVMRLRDTIPPLRFVLPFLRTPVNLLKFGLERSPVGFFNPSLWRNLAAKNPEASDQIARAFLGSTLAAGVAWQFGEGKITGAAPKNAAERDKFYREGKLPYAINVGGQWVSYQRLEPFNQTLSLVAAAVEAIQEEESTASEKVTDAISSIGNNLVSQTYLSGLNDLLGVLTQEDITGAKGRSFLGRYVSGFVPGSALLRTVAQATDPVFRQPRTVTESIKATIPGLSPDVPAKLNVWGEEVGRESPAISPIQITPANVSTLDAELGRLKVDVGFVGTSIGGEILKRDEQRQYQTLAGQASKAVLERRINSPAYQLLSDEDKEKAIEQAVSMVRDEARNTLRPDPDKPPIRGDQDIGDFVLEHLDYFDKRERLGYNEEKADRVALDKENPDIDAQGWRFSGKEPDTLQTAAAVNQALAMDLPNRPVKLANLARPINDDAKSIEAWKYSEKAITVYYETLTDRAGDAEAQRLYKKPYAQLDKEQQGRVKGNLREQAREQTPLLDAFLAYWGAVEVLKTRAAAEKLKEILARYGNKPPNPDFKLRLAEGAR